MPHETPAAKVVRLLGVKEIAFACGLTTDAVHKWKANGGYIPAQHQVRVFELAERKGVTLTAGDIIGVAA
jgi:hypothetical protein